MLKTSVLMSVYKNDNPCHFEEALLSIWDNQILKPFEISSQQYNVLRILKGQGINAISVNNIMSRMIDKMSNTSRLVEKLRKKELIERVTCEYDRRQVDVRITDSGLALLKEADKEMNQFDGMKGKLTEKEAVLLSELLEKIRA